jgi:hypothetical protein
MFRLKNKLNNKQKIEDLDKITSRGIQSKEESTGKKTL